MLRHSLAATLASLRFYRVDKLAFIEGDPDAPDGSCVATSWAQTLLRLFAGGRTKVIRLGNKSNVIAKHDQCVSEGFQDGDGRLIFLVDADYDRQKGALRLERSIVYSYGYSIENDVFNHVTLTEVVKLLVRDTTLHASISQRISSALKGIASRFMWAHVADQVANARNRSIFTRGKEGKPEVIISPAISTNKKRVLDRIKLAKAGRQSVNLNYVSYDFLCDGYGHVLDHIFFHQFRNIVAHYNKDIGLTKNAFRMISSVSIDDYIARDEDIMAYYAISFNAAGALE